MSRLLTPDDLAERWSVPKSHVYRLTREGRIPVVKLSCYYRYRLDEIERFEVGGLRSDQQTDWPSGADTPSAVAPEARF